MIVGGFSRAVFISCVALRISSIAPLSYSVQAFSVSSVMSSRAPTVSLSTPAQHCHSKMSSTLLQSSTISTTESSYVDNIDDGSSNTFRILCLHGKGGNGDEFLKRLSPLRTLLSDRLTSEQQKSDSISNIISIKWESLTAPYQISETDDDDAYYAWWTMPPGVRSFNANEYIGYDESASKVMNTVFPSTTAGEECDYDLILGHSQGAILLSALLATNKNMQQSKCSYILNGAAWPNPYKEALTTLSNQIQDVMLDTKMLFVMGKSDNINPIESAKQVHDCYESAGIDVSIVYHEGGHSVPTGKDQDSNRAMNDICDFILQCASEKAEKGVNAKL